MQLTLQEGQVKVKVTWHNLRPPRQQIRMTRNPMGARVTRADSQHIRDRLLMVQVQGHRAANQLSDLPQSQLPLVRLHPINIQENPLQVKETLVMLLVPVANLEMSVILLKMMKGPGTGLMKDQGTCLQNLMMMFLILLERLISVQFLKQSWLLQIILGLKTWPNLSLKCPINRRQVPWSVFVARGRIKVKRMNPEGQGQRSKVEALQ